jgi:hypothetical protein
MSDNNEIITVSSELNFANTKNTNFEITKRNYSNKHAGLLSLISSIPSVASELSSLPPNQVFQILIPNEIQNKIDQGMASIAKEGDIVAAVVRDKNGCIVKHLKLKGISINNATKIAKSLANQVVLANIVVQLKEIQESIEHIATSLTNDRLSQIDAGIALLKGARDTPDPFTQKLHLTNACQTLTLGFEQTFRDVGEHIKLIPRPEDHGWLGHFSTRPWEDGPDKKNEKYINDATKGLIYCMQCISAISECYLLLEDPSAARGQLKYFFNKVLNLNRGQVSTSVKYLPFNERRASIGSLWGKLPEHQEMIAKDFDKLLEIQDTSKFFAIDFKPEDLLGEGVECE